MPPTRQELSLLIHPLVPESVQHNRRVRLSVYPYHWNRLAKHENLIGSISTPIPHSLHSRHLSRYPRSSIHGWLRILFRRHTSRLRPRTNPPSRPIFFQCDRRSRRIFSRRKRWWDWRDRWLWENSGSWRRWWETCSEERCVEGCLVGWWCDGRGIEWICAWLGWCGWCFEVIYFRDLIW